MPVSQPLIRTFLLYITIGLSITACSSGSKESGDNIFGGPVIHGSGPDAGGDGFDVVAPEVNILFPPPSALTGADTMIVTGTADDITATASITVNGVRATSDDGFLTWRVRVPLNSGTNLLEVTSADTLGNRDTAAASTVVVNNPAFIAPQGIALNDSNTQLVIVDSTLGAVFALNLDSDQRTIISSADVGQGPALDFPFGVAVDDASNRAIVADVGTVPALVAVDLTTGDRTIISDASTGTGPEFTAPDNIALDLEGGRTRALLTDTNSNFIFAVDLTTGERTQLLDAGGALNFPTAITVDAINDRVLVVDVGTTDATVISINLVTGARDIISAPDGGVVLNAPGGITVDSVSGQIIVSDSELNALVRIDPGSGSRTIFSSDAQGDGDEFAFPVALVADDASRSFVVDNILSSVFEVSNVNGDRSTLSVAGIGGGVEFVSPFSIDIDRATSEALVTDIGSGTLYGVSFVTGERRVISDAVTGIGTALNFPSSVALRQAGSSAIVMDTGAPATVSIDLVNGDRTIISDLTTGGGDPFISPLGAALDTANNRLLVTNPAVSPDPNIDRGDNNFVLGVDLDTGNRSVVSRGDVTSPTAQPAIGSGPPFSFPQNIAVDSASQTGYVIDSLLDSLIVVDLSTGNRSTGPVDGSDFPRVTNNSTLESGLVQDVAVTPGEAVVTDSSTRTVYGFNTTSGTRREISGPDAGIGTELQSPVSIALDPATGTLFVVDNGLFAVMAIEPVSGDRVIVSR